MKKSILFIVLVIILVHDISFGQKPIVWTLQACISRAQEQNLNIKQSDIGYRSANSAYKTSQRAFLPNLNFNTTVGWNFGRSIDPTTNAFITQAFISNNGGIFTDIPIYQGGLLRNDLKSKRYKTLSSKATLEQQKRDIALQVTLLYMQILFQQDQIDIAQNQLNISLIQEERIQKLVDIGNSPPSDLYEINAQVATNEQLLTSAKNNYDKSILLITQALYLEDTEGFTIERPEIHLNANSDMPSMKVGLIYRKALRNEPIIAARNYDVQSALSNIKVARSGVIPSLRLTGSLGSSYSEFARTPNFDLQWQNRAPTRINGVVQNVEVLTPVVTSYDAIPYASQVDQNLRYGLSLGLNVPIFNRGQTSNNIQQSKLQHEQAQIALETASYKLKTDVSNALFDVRAAQKLWEAKVKTSTAKKISFEQTKIQFDLGNLSILDYTIAKNNYESAENEELIARYDLLFKRKILDYYLGNPLKF